MKDSLLKILLLVIIFISSSIILCAQSEFRIDKNYNSKRNFVLINGSLGGGDYPFAGLGITLSRQFFNGETMAGISFQYIGNTVASMYVDPVQVFPLMLDFRQKFMESRNGRFSAFVIADAGYVISITQNGEDEDGEFEYNNGWGISPGVAFRFNIFENIGMMLDVTWFHHKHPQVWLSPTQKESTKTWNLGQVRGNIFF